MRMLKIQTVDEVKKKINSHFSDKRVKLRTETIPIEQALGRIAAQTLLKTNSSLNRLRGGVHDFQGISLIVTFHPAALLRNPQWKRLTWEDVQQLRRLYDESCQVTVDGVQLLLL